MLRRVLPSGCPCTGFALPLSFNCVSRAGRFSFGTGLPPVILPIGPFPPCLGRRRRGPASSTAGESGRVGFSFRDFSLRFARHFCAADLPTGVLPVVLDAVDVVCGKPEKSAMLSIGDFCDRRDILGDDRRPVNEDLGEAATGVSLVTEAGVGGADSSSGRLVSPATHSRLPVWLGDRSSMSIIPPLGAWTSTSIMLVSFSTSASAACATLVVLIGMVVVTGTNGVAFTTVVGVRIVAGGAVRLNGDLIDPLCL